MKYGITIQRAISLIDSSVRPAPINPLRGQPGMVQIGSHRVSAVYHPAQEFEAKDAAATQDWNAKKQAQKSHECAAMALGMMCGHAV